MYEGTPKSGDQIADERGGDDDGPGAYHADCDGDQELTLIEPTVLLH